MSPSKVTAVAEGGVAGTNGQNADYNGEVSLSTQALSVFQDTLIAEMTEENSQLRRDSERLRLFGNALSTLRLKVIDKEYSLRLDDGRVVPAETMRSWRSKTTVRKCHWRYHSTGAGDTNSLSKMPTLFPSQV